VKREDTWPALGARRRCVDLSRMVFAGDVRLLDQTNDRKSVDRLLALFQVLDCEAELTVRVRKTSRGRAG
jgi:hypothetical protein